MALRRKRVTSVSEPVEGLQPLPVLVGVQGAAVVLEDSGNFVNGKIRSEHMTQ